MLAIGAQDVIDFDPRVLYANLHHSSESPLGPESQATANDPEKILLLDQNREGNLVICVSVHFIIILECNHQMDFTPVAVCKRPKPTTSTAITACWKTNSTSFVVVDPQHGAEFYDVFGFKQTPQNDPMLKLPLPSWITTGTPESIAGPMISIRFRTLVTSTCQGDPIQLCSCVAYRTYLLMGTGKSSIVRVLWTGEVVTDKETVFCEQPGIMVTQLSIGYGYHVGFVMQNGAFGVVTIKPGEDSSTVMVEQEGVLSCSMNKRRPVVAAGFQDGTIVIYYVSKNTTEVVRKIDFPRHEFTGLEGPCAVRDLQWNPDASLVLLANYTGVGCMTWGWSGCKLTCFLSNAESEPDIFYPAVWTLFGYRVIVAKHSKIHGQVAMTSTEIAKTSSSCSVSLSGSSAMCIHGWNYLLILINQLWDTNTMALQRLQIPTYYSGFGWPIRTVAVNSAGQHAIVAGSKGILLCEFSSREWKVLEAWDSPMLMVDSVFWWDDEVIGIIYVDQSHFSWHIIFVSRTKFSALEMLGSMRLPGMPRAVGVCVSESILTLIIGPSIYVYHVLTECAIDHIPQSPSGPMSPASQKKKGGPTKPSLFVMKRASSTVGKEIFYSVEHIELEQMAVVNLDFLENPGTVLSFCVLPSGGTRRAGMNVRFPKCVLLSCSGTLFSVDTDEGTYETLAKGIFEIFTQSWSKVDESDDVVLDQYFERTASGSDVDEEYIAKLPSVLLFAIWLSDKQGLRLWLPALDMRGEFLNTKCLDKDWDVLPAGILETHGLVVGLSQRRRNISKLAISSYDIALRVLPTTHGYLEWLVRASRFDLASQVLVQASLQLPLFMETLDLLLFSAIENDYKIGGSSADGSLLRSIVQVLRKGKMASILNTRAYASLVITCARKIEVTRWPIYFEAVGNPEQIFNDSIYNGDLKTAAGSMLVADFFTPEKSAKRLAALAHAAKLQNDHKLLADINHFMATKLN